MRLSSRDLEPGDIEQCFAVLCNRHAYDRYDPGLAASVPRAWSTLMESGAMTGDVVEDLDRPVGSRAVGFGAGVFVTDAFAEEAETTMPPFARAQLVERILRGRSPAFTAAEVRAAKGGRHLFVVEDMLGNSDLAPEELREVRNKGVEVGLARFRCHRLQSWLSEVYGVEAKAMVESAGATVRRDYADHLAKESASNRECDRPFLVGMTREEALVHDGSVLSMLFAHTPRRFYLRPVEQVTLRRALLGATDEEIAASFGLSLSAIKKRWTTIYERVQRSDPNLLPVSAHEGVEHTRGAEKRRHLLNYLRQHPEELHQNAP